MLYTTYRSSLVQLTVPQLRKIADSVLDRSLIKLAPGLSRSLLFVKNADVRWSGRNYLGEVVYENDCWTFYVTVDSESAFGPEVSYEHKCK